MAQITQEDIPRIPFHVGGRAGRPGGADNTGPVMLCPHGVMGPTIEAIA